MPDTKEPVVFKLGDTGEEASNDPRWLAAQMKKQIEAQGASSDNLAGNEFASQVADMDQKELKAKAKELDLDINGVRKLSELRARVAAKLASNASGADDEDVDDDDDEE